MMESRSVSINKDDFNGIIEKLNQASANINSGSDEVRNVSIISSNTALSQYQEMAKNITGLLNHYHLLLNMDISALKKSAEQIEKIDEEASH